MSMFDEDLGDISLSTVDPNPSIDQSTDVGDTSSATDWINGLGQWGAVITSIATKTPVQAAPSGYITGARQSSLLGSSSSSQMLLTIVLVAIGALVLVSFFRRDD